MGTRYANHVTPLYPQKLALTPPTGGGRSVGMVRSRTKATEFSFSVNDPLVQSSTERKGKLHPRTGNEGPEGEQRYSSTLSLTSAPDEGGWTTPCPSRFISGKGPRAGLDGCEKSRPPPGFDPRTVQHVASLYTDSAIPAPA